MKVVWYLTIFLCAVGIGVAEDDADSNPSWRDTFCNGGASTSFGNDVDKYFRKIFCPHLHPKCPCPCKKTPLGEPRGTGGPEESTPSPTKPTSPDSNEPIDSKGSGGKPTSKCKHNWF
jgi:hypothetical protein